jgi:hypothetical protein
MATGTGRLNTLYQELESECAEYAREHGAMTAAQCNEIAARLMEAARNNPPARVTVMTVGPHGT